MQLFTVLHLFLWQLPQRKAQSTSGTISHLVRYKGDLTPSPSALQRSERQLGHLLAKARSPLHGPPHDRWAKGGDGLCTYAAIRHRLISSGGTFAAVGCPLVMGGYPCVQRRRKRVSIGVARVVQIGLPQKRTGSAEASRYPRNASPDFCMSNITDTPISQDARYTPNWDHYTASKSQSRCTKTHTRTSF